MALSFGESEILYQVIALRAVQSEDFMTADWYVLGWMQPSRKFFLISLPCRFAFPPEVLRKISSRITNEVVGINRVTYDISSKPPAVRSLDFYKII